MQLHERDLPDDVDQLKALVLEKQSLATELESRLAAKSDRISELEHTVHLLSKWAFGPRTEKRAVEPEPPVGQEWLPFAELMSAAQRVADRSSAKGTLEIQPAREPRKPSKRRTEFPDHLPRVRSNFELPEAERVCCG